MAWQAEHKKTTRQRILASAAKLFALNGYEGMSINAVMADAGLTRGAFYSHFKSKSELHAESMMSSAKKIALSFESDLSENFVETYLSTGHREGDSRRCPLAFMIGDVTQRDTAVRETYTTIFKGFVRHLAAIDTKQPADSEPDDKAELVMTQALQKAVLLIGGMAVSRAINDEELAERLLNACQRGVLDNMS